MDTTFVPAIHQHLSRT